jgi:hypothetical protein
MIDPRPFSRSAPPLLLLLLVVLLSSSSSSSPTSSLSSLILATARPFDSYPCSRSSGSVLIPPLP